MATDHSFECYGDCRRMINSDKIEAIGIIRDDTGDILASYCDKCVEKIIIETEQEREIYAMRAAVLIPKSVAVKKLKEMGVDVSDFTKRYKTVSDKTTQSKEESSA